MIKLLQTLIPIPVDTNGGSTDPAYILGFYITMNFIFLLLFLFGVIRFLINKPDEKFLCYVLGIDDVYADYIGAKFGFILFLTLNGTFGFIRGAFYITEHFIKK